MNVFTKAAWDVINEAVEDDEALREDLKKMLLKDNTLFLSPEQSFQANIHAFHAYFLDKFNQWYEWLPDSTSNIIGAELAKESFQFIDWHYIAEELRKQLVLTSAEKRESCSNQRKSLIFQ